ncbi:MAG TPA: trypsin-like serine protease [Gemmatimonadales bacterium]|nr:trypsin-like serine protease [Gemmatimonadales bacterium]
MRWRRAEACSKRGGSAGRLATNIACDSTAALYWQLEASLPPPPAEDIALVFLDSDVVGVTPAPIAGAGYLDELDLKNETFTVVGYGTDAFITGSAASPKAITVFDGIRSYREVTAIPARDAFPDRFLKITAGVCFGDSGGPLFHEDTVVAINTWTFSYRCDGPNLEYRVDSSTAQAFLGLYL